MPVSLGWTKGIGWIGAEGRRYVLLYRRSQRSCVVLAVFARLIVSLCKDVTGLFCMGAKLGSRREVIEDLWLRGGLVLC